MEQTKRNRIAAITVGALVLAGVLGGGGAALASVNQARNDAATQHAVQVKADAEQAQIEAQMQTAAEAAVQAQQDADDAAWVQHLADVKAAEEKAAADAQAAAEAQAAADAKAAADAAVKAPVKRASGGGWAPGHAPGGTPIPTFVVTDPNAGNFGQRDIVDPASFCDSQSGSGDINHAVCD